MDQLQRSYYYGLSVAVFCYETLRDCIVQMFSMLMISLEITFSLPAVCIPVIAMSDVFDYHN
jgi:hypothetical protein